MWHYSWYYGKTAGLMGTYDNEPANDMTTSDNTLASNVETLANSWTVGRRCRPVNRAVVAHHDDDSPRYRACAQLFNNESSIFRPCYRIVSPSPFLAMCLNDDTESAKTDVCRVAASYVHECRRLEVHLRMPTHCGECRQYLLQSWGVCVCCQRVIDIECLATAGVYIYAHFYHIIHQMQVGRLRLATFAQNLAISQKWYNFYARFLLKIHRNLYALY